MKKRIISIALVVVMIVAMIPATLLTAMASSYNGYANGHDVYFSETELTLDGQKDAVYENSERIWGGKVVQHKGAAQGTGFDAYAVATNTGFYVFATVKDSTVDKSVETTAGKGTGDGDKLQIYMQVKNTVADTTKYQWGGYDFDFAHDTSAQNAACTSASTIIDGGYTIETFIPWSVWNKVGDLSLATATVYFGIQVNNYDINEAVYKEMVTDSDSTGDYYLDAYKVSDNAVAPTKFMVKANVITSPKSEATATVKKYRSFVTRETITLDGKRDDIYLASEAITAGHVATGVVGKDTGFTTYTAATKDGIYVFSSIYDDTLNKAELVNKAPEVDALKEGEESAPLRIQDGDKFQLYFEVGHNIWRRWGYIDFDYVDGGRHVVTEKSNGYQIEAEIQQIATLWEDGKGWDIEIFIPYGFCGADVLVDNTTTPNYLDLACEINIQVANEECYEWNPATGACYDYNEETRPRTTRNRTGLAYDVAGADDSWSNNADFVPLDFSVNPVSWEGTGAVVYTPSVTIDGTKDAGYGDDSTAIYINKNTSSNCAEGCTSAFDAKAWVVVTDTKVAVYAEVTDDYCATDGSGDDAIDMYLYFPLTGTTTWVGYGYNRTSHTKVSSDWGYGDMCSTNGVGKSNGRLRSTSVINLGNNKYALEMCLDLPYAERLALSEGKDIKISIGLDHYDCCKHCKYDGSSVKSHTCSYANSRANWYWTAARSEKQNAPAYIVNNKLTAASLAVDTKITSANVALSESITVNYYANVNPTANTPVMKFTFNDKVTFVEGVPTANANEYKFAFEGLAPQCMGDNIKAELYVGGNVIDSLDEYSVKKNVTNLTKDEEDPSVELKNLVDALLLYGAAAQQYTNYKATETELVADLSNLDLSNIWNVEEKNVKKVENTADKAKFVAAGVRFANVNKLYVKVDNVENVTSLTVKVEDGESVALELNSNGVAYTDAIKATEFGTVYTFELTDTNGMSSKLTYSVNSYVYAKTMAASDYDSNIAVLSIALYNYGVAAEAYIAN